MADHDAGRETLVQAEDLWAACGLLTVLPVPMSARGARAAWAWPLAGLLVALIAWACAAIGLALGLTPGLAAALALAAGMMATGALHEDGLADCADGLFGGDAPGRRLEIMKDSRIGSFGTLALIVTVLARWSALSALISMGAVLAPLVMAAVLSRAALPVVMRVLPPARASGLSVATGLPPREAMALGLGLAAAIALILGGWMAVPVALFGGAAVTAVATLAARRIGGQTGDVLGAAQQMAELAILAVLAAAL